MKVLITGSNGFIAKNLCVRLTEICDFEAVVFSKGDSKEILFDLLANVDAVVHLAGVNRPQSSSEFALNNVELTRLICNCLIEQNRAIPVIFSSSMQAVLNNDYGRSKHDAEAILRDYARVIGAKVYIYRLPNVFGKWSKPYYNSVVATFCYEISHDLPIKINDESVLLKLVYIDDVIDDFITVLKTLPNLNIDDFRYLQTEYDCTVGELAKLIKLFKHSRDNLTIEAVGSGFLRALYATYISFLSPELCSYKIPNFVDERGAFSEILKTKDAGQFSFFTAHAGITRGGHYHHTKTEKFLVIKGQAKFGFRHIVTNEYYELFTSDKEYQIVETIPGWWHDITNIGEDEMIVLLWANEVFDREHPDTYYLAGNN